jgi:sigma-B regulation protein RsbU (phosphoserine phosphatase)
MLCVAGNMFSEQLTVLVAGVPREHHFPAPQEPLTLTGEQQADIRSQRALIGASAISLLASGYAMFIVVLSREGARRMRLQAEVAIAARIQQSLIPSRLFRTSWCEVAGKTIPATEVGGDYFDVVQISSDEIAVIIADVAGHGVGAGILSAMTKSALRSQLTHSAMPVAVLQNLNTTIHQVSERNMFVTVAYIFLSARDRMLRMATAGHPPVLLRHGTTEKVEELRTASLALGLQKDSTFSEIQYRWSAGDALLLYTDGVTEATNRISEQFGVERLQKAFSGPATPGADKACEQLLEGVALFSGSTVQTDDATIVHIHFQDARPPPLV